MTCPKSSSQSKSSGGPRSGIPILIHCILDGRVAATPSEIIKSPPKRVVSDGGTVGELQPINAHLPTVVTASGIVMLVQSSNADWPMVPPFPWNQSFFF